MKFFRATKISSLLGQAHLLWVRKMKKILKHEHIRRKTEKNQRELLKMGNHLLRDLGFDAKGCPLNSCCGDKTN